MAGKLITFENVDTFRDIKDFPAKSIKPEIINTMRSLDEREEIEPFLRAILADENVTPHGPAEIVDILTHKVIVDHQPQLAAFIIKGRSFPTVRPKHISHQVYRLEKIVDLSFAVLAVTGNILDQAKEEFVSVASRLNCKYLILDARDLARLFVAYGFYCPKDGRRISAGRCRCGYSPRKRLLNILQKQALTELKQAHAIKQKAALVVLPPGTGKTRIAAEDASFFRARSVLYIAHTHEILDIAMSECAAVFGAQSVQKSQTRNDLDHPTKVNLTTIQFLAKHLNHIAAQHYDYIVVDEFHHAAAHTYRKVLDSLKGYFLLGLTATPFRGDRQDIAELCNGNIVVNSELRTGIDNGILAPYHYYGAFDDIDYSAIKCNAISYNIHDLERALVIPARDKAVIKKWRELAEGSPTLAFCCTKHHANRVARSFIEEGIPTEVYLSTTTQDQRRAIVKSFELSKIKVICVVDVINEGADFPFIECLLFLRPTESKRIFLQQLGRGLRRSVGKSHCTVIDFIGNFRNAYRIVEYHGLLPYADETEAVINRTPQNVKELLNLPIGCEVHFDDHVIDIFAQQTLSPRFATRHTIGRILLYQYERLGRRLRRMPTKKDVDHNCMLQSDFYKDVFGSWKIFENIAASSMQFESRSSGSGLNIKH
ncbi:MAG: DEAD/DEAH box helicase [Thermodesulfovibrionales bacterium]|nr:DEAD/DEAH box helicase [Thermodesulfovibrionales bacterium]